MAQVISMQDALSTRMKPGSFSPDAFSAKLHPKVAAVAFQQSATREDVYRAILLLDLAAQQMRVLLRNIADPSRKGDFEKQITAIEEAIQHARDLALKL
jgi:hypothetical protein